MSTDSASILAYLDTITPESNVPELLFRIIFENALKSQDYNIIEKMISKKFICASFNDNFAIKFMLSYNIKDSGYEIIKLLLKDENVDLKISENIILYYAASDNQIDLMKILLNDSRIKNINDRANNPLRSACIKGHVEMVKLLLADKRIEPTLLNNLIFRSAVLHDNYEIAKLLLTNPKIDPSDYNNDAIYTACSINNQNMIKLLLTDSRVDPNIRPDKITEIYNKGNIEIIKLFIKNPKFDLSKISDVRILHIAEQECNTTDEIFSKKITKMMQIQNVKGVLIDDQGKTILIRDNEMIQIKN